MPTSLGVMFAVFRLTDDTATNIYVKCVPVFTILLGYVP